MYGDKTAKTYIMNTVAETEIWRERKKNWEREHFAHKKTHNRTTRAKSKRGKRIQNFPTYIYIYIYMEKCSSARPGAEAAGPAHRVRPQTPIRIYIYNAPSHISNTIMLYVKKANKSSSQRISLNRSQYRSCSTGYNPLTSNQVVYKWFCAPTFDHSNMALAIRRHIRRRIGPDNRANSCSRNRINTPPDTGEQQHCYLV